MANLRIDKYLWAVRLYKTRSIATEACKKAKVLLNDVKVKASKEISIGDKISISKPPIIYTYEVKALLKNRVGAKMVSEYLTNTTPEAELNKLEEIKCLPYIFISQKEKDDLPKKTDVYWII